MSHTTNTIDQARLDDFIGRFVQDLGAVMHATTVLIGDKLGLYRAMSDGQPVTAAELADLTGCDRRYLTEWLGAQAASGYVDYDPGTGRFRLSPEQAFALTNEDNPLFAPGGMQVAASTIKDTDLLAEAIRTGRGVEWGEHHHDLFAGTERFFKPNYIGNLVDEWLPALDGVVDKLTAGGTVADIGCGHGASTILMARAFPQSTFFGYDYHAPSIEAAREAARKAGVADRCQFEVASAKDYPGTGYDLVTFFDALHDMGDPVGAAAHVRQSLAFDGTWMVVEPRAGDRVEDNLNPVGRIFYSASTLVCLPVSRSQEVDLALGAQAGPARIREVTGQAGYSQFRVAAETPFNLVFEVRP
jgi:SAM-dependent methyltransferase